MEEATKVTKSTQRLRIMQRLYHKKESGVEYIPAKEKEAHPAAEYFTAERAVTKAEAADGVKRVTLVFRKIATKSGVHVKGGEECSAAAGRHNGKLVLFEGEQADPCDELLGVLVRTVSHYVE